MNVSGAHKRTASAGALHLVVGIASTGRREILATTLRHLACQARQPDEVVVCVWSTDDIDQSGLADLTCPSRVLMSPRGSCCQRNRILDTVSQADVVIFLDDDFLMAPSYLEQVEQLFAEHSNVVIATGTVIADGITGPGISVQEGTTRLETAQLSADYDPDPLRSVYCGYGCNMAVRMSAIDCGNLRFDEALPLYGWLEYARLRRGIEAVDTPHGGALWPRGQVHQAERRASRDEGRTHLRHAVRLLANCKSGLPRA